MQHNSFENIPQSFLNKWQEIADLIANIIEVPAALIMKVENEFMEVFTTSETENNPYNIGDKENWHGLYCETVIKTQKKLRVPNALKDKDWDKNPDLKLGMIAYLGFPINFPDNTPFGTLCVLDNKERQFSADNEKLLLQFKKVIELDLALIFSLELDENSSNKAVIQQLISSNEEYQAVNEEYIATNEELKQSYTELSEAKRMAEENEQRFRLMYENTSMGIAVISLDFKIDAANDAYCEMLGYTEEELIGKTLKDITGPEDVNDNLDLQTQLKQGRIDAYQIEKRFIHKDGHLVYGLLNATLVKNAQSEALYFLGNVQNITERKKAEEALRESEATIRNKLKVILEPEGDIETLNLADIINVEELQPMMESLFKTTSVGGAILDISGKVLVSSAMEDICAKFHRVNPDTAKNCLESDLALADGVPAGTFKAYRCKNNMWDMVSPIVVGGKHLGNIYIGQLFYEDEQVDYELFRKQARQHGFDETEYMAALDRVPRLKRETVDSAMAFYAKFAGMISSLSYSKIKLSRDNAQRRKAEKALRANEEKLRSIYRVAPTGIGLVVSRVLKDVNPRVCEMIGYTREALLEKNARILYPSQEEYEFVGEEKYKQIRKTGTGKVETVWQKKDGTIINVLLASTPIDKNDYSKGVIFTALDITERKQVEKALMESELTFRKLFEDSSDAILLIDETGVFVECNRAALELLKMTREQFLFLSPTEISPEIQPNGQTSKEATAEMINFAYEKGHHRFDWVHINAEREEFIVEISLMPIVLRGKTLLHTTWRDITERKKIENELKEKTSFLSTLMETSPVGIVTADKTGNISYANNRAEQILGLVKEEITSRSYDAPLWKHTELDGSPFPDEKQPFNIVKESLHTVFDIQHGITWPDGSVKILSINAAPIKDSTGQFDGMIASIEDITELKQAEKALKKEKAWSEKIVNNAPNIIVGLGKKSIIKVFNRYAERLTGYRAQEVIGKKWINIFVPEDLKKTIYEVWGDIVKNKRIDHSFENEIITKSGEKRLIEWRNTMLTEKDEFRMILSIGTDITERKQAEQKLTEQKELLAAIYRNAPLIMMVVNSERRIQQINGYATQLTGTETKDMLGLRNGEALRCVHALDDPKGCGFGEFCQQCVIRNSILDTLETGKTHLQEEAPYFFIEEDDKIREMTFMTSTTAIMVQGERMVLVTLQDITERKKAEMIIKLQYNIARASITTRNLNELFDSVKSELNRVIDSENIFIALYNEETEMFYSPFMKNEKEDIREWPAEKSLSGWLIRRNRPLLLHKDDIMRLYQEGNIDLIGTVSEAWLGIPLKTDGKLLGAFVVQNYDDASVYDQSSIEIMELVAHELSMFIDRQHSEEKVNKLTRAVEQSSVAVVITDKDGRIEYVNPFFTELTGYRREEVMGRNPNILQSGQHSKAFYQELWNTILAGKEWEGEFRNKKKTGELYWEKAVITPIVNDKGLIKNFVAVKEDITERKKMLEELVRAKEKAEENDRLKTAFLNNMSHEIRTPLNAICGFTEVLNNTEITEEKRERLVSIIQNSSNQLLSIVTDILTISSLETKQEKVYIEKASVNTIIDDLLLIFKQQASDRNISLYAKKDLSDKASVIYTDNTKITQILSNLLSNALKFTHEGFIDFGYELIDLPASARPGSVSNSNLPASEDPGSVLQFYVKDSGIGIKPEVQETIFDRFIQADKSISSLYGGTGLGLSISKAFAELLGGEIWVESQPEKGSAFYFTIPYKPAEKPDKTPPPPKINNTSGVVLVAEDEENNYLLIEEYLSDLDLKLIHAKDGQEALDICQSNSNIDLILMDIKMPIMTGDEAAKRIKEINPNLSIIAQSGYALEHEIKRYKELFDDYLAKPIKQNDLRECVMKFIKTGK
jgi:PAS domain S-box-containing protein